MFFGLPENFKIRHGLTKWILRQSLTEIVPIRIINRYDKMGFVTPEIFWMKKNTDVFKEEFLLSCEILNKFIDLKKANTFIASYPFNNGYINSIVWRTICAGHWMKVFQVLA